MCGVGDPETGDRFAKGAHHFTAIADTLKWSTPTEQWHGRGSDAYAAENEQQQERAAKMSKIDAEVKGIVANEAKQISNTRTALEIVATSLTFMIPIAIAIGKIPPTGRRTRWRSRLAQSRVRCRSRWERLGPWSP